MEPLNPGRREFLVRASLVAGGMALGLVPCRASATADRPWAEDSPGDLELSPWLQIAPDDTVTIRVPTPEIGNGSMTQVAMNVAEELACDWDRVRVEFCSIHRDYLEGGVYNVGFLPFFGGHGTDGDRMKHALQLGASARERLRTAAASRWNVPVSEVQASNSTLFHADSGRRLRFGEVAADATAILLDEEPELKPREQWSFLGKASPSRLHIPAVVRGEATFGIDVKLPGMVHAALKQSPVHGGRLKSHDPEAVINMPGVRAVVVLDPAKTRGTDLEQKSTWGFSTNQVQSAVAVIADHYWQAKTALDSLPVEWEAGTGKQWQSSDQLYAAGRAQLDLEGGRVSRQSGDVSAATSGRVVEQVYSTPYCENAMIEPLNGTAMVTESSAEVWCPTQDMLQAYWVAIDETGFAPEDVRLHQTFVGGRFGRSTQGDDVRMVVAVAREFPGVPVKTIWSREECFAQGRFRTPIFTRFKGVLGEDGYPVAVTSRAAFIGTHPLFQLSLGYDDMPYFTSGIIPNVHISQTKVPNNILNGAYRAPCLNSHAFMLETFIDECAVEAGIDSLEYRLRLVSKWDKSWSDCLRVAAQKAGWGQELPRGEGLGIAITAWPSAAKRRSGTVICAAARVAVSRSGELDIKQIDVAFDCGRVANPDNVRSQVEGGTLFGLNMTLYEKLTIEEGVVVERNFDEYRILRMGDRLPQVNVHFDALSGHERFDLVGEVPVGPVGPAVGNAIFQATGKRLRSTPFIEQDLSWG